MQIRKDKKDLNITLNDAEVFDLSKRKFKTLIEEKIHLAVKHYLDNLKRSHSKSALLPEFTGKPEKYLLSKKLNTEQKQNLFKLKTRLINVADNF